MRTSMRGCLNRWAARVGGPAVLGAMIVLWLGGTAGGLAVLASYAVATRPAATTPPSWPADTRIARNEEAPSVAVFLHPRCPCSSATVTELGRVLARVPGDVRVTVAFYAPRTEPAGWGRGALRTQAESLPGVSIIDDPEGREARLFGAVNSGHVVAYGRDGRLLFAGGITASRGHEGDNAGEDSLVSALQGGAAPVATTPTYGCEIAPAACEACTGEDAP